MIPTGKEFFFVQLKVSGTIGRPVAFASWITPIWTTCPGPFGPSGVTTRSTPDRPNRMSWRSATVPPLVVEPLTECKPNRFAIR